MAVAPEWNRGTVPNNNSVDLIVQTFQKNGQLFSQNNVFLKFPKILPRHVKKGRFAMG